MYLPGLPMTQASSTSQSTFVEPRGIVMVSLGPQMLLVAFMKMTGSFGTSTPDSLAWSA
jgi:hypothetical protein